MSRLRRRARHDSITMFTSYRVGFGTHGFGVTPRFLLHPVEGWRYRRDHRFAELGPDGRDEIHFHSLDGSDPDVAAALRKAYVEVLAAAGELPPSALERPAEWVDLRVAPDDNPGVQRLRITSRFTGGTRWLYDWDGAPQRAIDFVRDAADLDAFQLEHERLEEGVSSWRDLYKDPPEGTQ